MRLAAKIIVTFLVSAVILLVIDGLFALRREQDLFTKDAEVDARLVGRAMQIVVGDVWRRYGEEEALSLVAEIDQESRLMEIRWVWLDELASAPAKGLKPGDVRQLRAGKEVVARRREGAHRFLVTYVPAQAISGREGALELVEDLALVEGAVRSTLIRISALTLGLSLLAVILAVPVGMRVVGRPLQKLVERTRRIGLDDFSEPLRLAGGDELTELANALNVLCERLAESRARLTRETEARIATLDQLRHEDRLRTVGRLAAGVAHELGTPLNVIHGRAGLIAKGQVDGEQVVKAAEIIRGQVDSMIGVVRDLLDFARKRSPKKEKTQPAEIAREVVALLGPMARKKGVVLRIADDAQVGAVQADSGQIRQALTNLVVNGLQALQGQGTVKISLTRGHAVPAEGVDAEPGDYLQIVVEDDGVGIAEEDLPHLFEPFFTTKDVGEGTGLGLAIAHGIVREHGGWIEVSKNEGAGSRFSVFLPLEEGA
jgi:signal transduction histidine kinase